MAAQRFRRARPNKPVWATYKPLFRYIKSLAPTEKLCWPVISVSLIRACCERLFQIFRAMRMFVWTSAVFLFIKVYLLYSALSINVNTRFDFLVGEELTLNLANVGQEEEKP